MSKNTLDSRYSDFSAEKLAKLPTIFTGDTVDPAETTATMSQLNVIEKTVVRIIERMTGASKVSPEKDNGDGEDKETVHLLDDADRSRMAYQMNKAIFIAAVAGALSAVACELVEIGLMSWMDYDGEPGWPSSEFVNFTLANLALSGIVSCLELALVYAAVLWTSVVITNVARLNLWPMDFQRSLIAGALARASLELEHPSDAKLGIDPRTGASTTLLLAAAMLYAGRRGVTKFLSRILLKKVVARAAAKSILDWIAIPINVIWNVLTVRTCMNESKICIIGPSAMVHMLDELVKGHKLENITKVFMLKAIGAVVVRKRAFHPNLFHALHYLEDSYITDEIIQEFAVIDAKHDAEVAAAAAAAEAAAGEKPLLIRLKDWAVAKAKAIASASMYGDEKERHYRLLPLELDNVNDFIEGLADLQSRNKEDADIVLGVFVCALIIDGSVSTREARLLTQCLKKAGRNPGKGNFSQVRHLTYKVAHGHTVDREEIVRAVQSDSDESELSAKEVCSERCDRILDCINVC